MPSHGLMGSPCSLAYVLKVGVAAAGKWYWCYLAEGGKSSNAHQQHVTIRCSCFLIFASPRIPLGEVGAICTLRRGEWEFVRHAWNESFRLWSSEYPTHFQICSISFSVVMVCKTVESWNRGTPSHHFQHRASWFFLFIKPSSPALVPKMKTLPALYQLNANPPIEPPLRRLAFRLLSYSHLDVHLPHQSKLVRPWTDARFRRKHSGKSMKI